jgi:glycosyltransferase involved in cell wall biosynthesis
MNTGTKTWRTRVSLIATVYNDVEGTQLFLRRMEEQTRKPDEIVIVDAGSKDGTWEALQAYATSLGAIPTNALQVDRCKPAPSRNIAARKATYDILAVTDIGCDWQPQFFEELVAPFENQPDLEAVMGSWEVLWENQTTPWAQADPLLRNGLELRASPNSHAANRAIAYTKDFYLGLGGLPEDLSFACDDMALALFIQCKGKRIAAAPVPRCVWFRPQTYLGLKKESFRNFKGAGEAGIWISYFVRNLIRFVLEWAAFCGLVAGLMLGWPTIANALCLLTLLLMMAWRLRNWIPHWLVIRRRGGIATLGHVAILDYVTRWSAVKGYWAGVVHGGKACTGCRSKLRACGHGWW